MNKKMLLLAAFAIGTQSILPLAASADAMYNDIKQVMVEDALTGKTDQEKYDNTVRVLNQLHQDKRFIKNSIVSIYTQHHVHPTEMIQVLVGLSGILFSGAGYSHYYKDYSKAVDLGVFGAIAVGGALVTYFTDARHIARNKKKIAEINEVITKLEAMKTELADKLGIVEIERV